MKTLEKVLTVYRSWGSALQKKHLANLSRKACMKNVQCHLRNWKRAARLREDSVHAIRHVTMAGRRAIVVLTSKQVEKSYPSPSYSVADGLFTWDMLRATRKPRQLSSRWVAGSFAETKGTASRTWPFTPSRIILIMRETTLELPYTSSLLVLN